MSLLAQPRFASACDPSASHCYARRLPGWDRINDHLPGAIRLTDIDGMVEVNGSFLFIEAKGAGVAVPEGQLIALRRLTTQGDIEVIITRPAANNLGATENLVIRNGYAATDGYELWTHDRFWDYIDTWVAHANGEMTAVTP